MYFNVETATLSESLNSAPHSNWNAVATDLLQQYDHNVAVGKIAEAIQEHVRNLGMPTHSLVATLYQQALRRVDFCTLALGTVHAAEAAHPAGAGVRPGRA